MDETPGQPSFFTFSSWRMTVKNRGLTPAARADALGTTRLMTRPDQSTAAAYTYDAWGKIILQTGEGSNRHKFTGREWDAEISLQYNRARFYDPEIGRFITQDPLTKGPDDPTVMYYSGVYSVIHRYLKEYIDALQPDKTNRYTYCTNNPINKVDPLGLADDKDKTEGVKAAANAEQTGKTKDQEAGKPDRTGTEQKGKTSGDVRESEGVQKKGSDGTAVEKEKGEAKSGHRESLTVTEAGDKIFTVSEGDKSCAINLGRDPQSFGGKQNTQPASRDISSGSPGGRLSARTQDYIGRVFEGSRIGGGHGGGITTRIGPVELKAGGHSINAQQITPEGIKQVTEDYVGVKGRIGNYAIEASKTNGVWETRADINFGGDRSLSNGSEFRMGGTIPHPATGMAINVELVINVEQIPYF